MQRIIKDYYLQDNSYLVSWQIGKNGVDCWFDTQTLRQHRALSFEDFETINPNK